MKTIPIYCAGGNDLYPEHGHSQDMKCACGLDLKFQRSGYNDWNFWHNVFGEPRDIVCECGKKYAVQWTQGGITIEDKP